jgi:hypothetical protein
MLANEPNPQAGPTLYVRQVCTSSGRGVLTEFLKKEAAARADFRVRVKLMACVERVKWNENYFKFIRDEIYEIKWKSGQKQWRALGFDYVKGSFVVVRGCTHKDGVYDPPDWIDRAIEIKNETKAGLREIIDYDI